MVEVEARSAHDRCCADVRAARPRQAQQLYSDYTFGLWRRTPAAPTNWSRSARPIPASRTRNSAGSTSWVRNHTIARFGPVREVEKTFVLEVAFDAAQLSTPQIRRRAPFSAHRPAARDKPAHEADRLETLMAFVENRPAGDQEAA